MCTYSFPDFVLKNFAYLNNFAIVHGLVHSPFQMYYCIHGKNSKKNDRTKRAESQGTITSSDIDTHVQCTLVDKN